MPLSYCKPKVKRVSANHVFNFLNKVVDESLGTTYPAHHTSPGTSRVNIVENKDDFQIEALLPGFAKSNIQITLDKNLLIISAEKKQDDPSEEAPSTTANYRRREFTYATFKRSFELPKTIVTNNIEAEHKNGILTIHLPKQELTVAPVQTIEIV